MSKTYSTQVEKARTLVAGLRKNCDQVKSYGVTEETLNRLERAAEEVSRMDNELDALRAQVSEKASVANKELNALREQVQSLKQVVKKNFEQADWESLGVPDKR